MGLQELLPPIAEPSVLGGQCRQPGCGHLRVAGADFIAGKVYQPAEAGGPGLSAGTERRLDLGAQVVSAAKKPSFPAKRQDA